MTYDENLGAGEWIVEADEPAVPPETAQVELLRLVVEKETRSWGWWSLGLGALHLFTGGFLSAPWGIILLLVGGASFLFKEGPMLVVYGVTLGWVALLNIMALEGAWIGFGLMQGYLSYRVFRQFFQLRGVADQLEDQEWDSKTRRVFPFLGCGLSAAVVLGILGLIGTLIIMAIFGVLEPPDFLTFPMLFLLDLTGLGLGVALASLLSRHRYKGLSIAAIVVCVLVTGFRFYLMM